MFDLYRCFSLYINRRRYLLTYIRHRYTGRLGWQIGRVGPRAVPDCGRVAVEARVQCWWYPCSIRGTGELSFCVCVGENGAVPELSVAVLKELM